MVWNAASPMERFALLFTVFLVLCAQLFYLIWAFAHRRSKRWIITAVWFVLMFAAFAVLFEGDALNAVPLWVLWSGTVLSAGFITGIIIRGAHRDKNRITRASIKEAMDNLPVAGCYFTERGTVKLCNRQLYRLFHVMTGRDLQTLSELHEALENSTDYGIVRAHDGGYVFPDGRVWHYTEQAVTADNGCQFTESVFTDATELSAANEELLGDNRELERINQKLQKMYARAEDRIREREYLAFKMRIHDDIGRSLTMIRKMLQGEIPTADIEKQLKTLSVAAGTLVYTPKANSDDPYDRMLLEANELGVEVQLDGMLPMEPLIYELVVSAVRECVTNCVRHAHGSTVTVRVMGLPGGYTVFITNDGERPKGTIAEGGGLANLRRRIEQAGGEMTVSHYPVFVLKLTLMREEMEL